MLPGNPLDEFCKRNIGVLEDLVDTLELEIDEMYLTDQEWDAIHEQVIDPITKAIQYLEGLDSIQPDPIDEIDF
jgi:hypothetical protein